MDIIFLTGNGGKQNLMSRFKEKSILDAIGLQLCACVCGCVF